MLPQPVNRHGCITGATGTGKTVTLQVIAQALSGIGVTRRKDTMVEAMVKSAARSIGSQVGREIIRGVPGSILKK